jgi:spore germination protein GerM
VTVVELIKGPEGNLIPTLPPRARLLTLQISDAGVAKVNFSAALSKDHPGGSSAEMMTVYSIVNSLTLNFPRIKRVQIVIEGKVSTEYLVPSAAFGEYTGYLCQGGAYSSVMTVTCVTHRKTLSIPR